MPNEGSCQAKAGKQVRRAHRGDCVSSALSRSPHTEKQIIVDGYLVDTGSPVTLVPTRMAKNRSHNPVPSLIAANGSVIRTKGTCQIEVNVAGCLCQHEAIVADVVRPILGLDFLFANKLLIDVRKGTIGPADDGRKPSIQIAAVDYNRCQAKARLLVAQYPSLVDQSLGQVNSTFAPLRIETVDAPPVYHKARPLFGEKREQIESEILSWEAEGIIERVTKPVHWASPVHAVKKSDGSWRVCGDFRSLNLVTKFDRYPLPSLTTFNARMAGSAVFSKVDLKRAYHQVPVHEDDRHKTTINTTCGLFQFRRMPFGLRNAGAQFQRNIHLILKDLEFVFIYMDDLMIFSPSVEKHLEHLDILFRRLAEHGVKINFKKCQFGQSEMEFLGHVVTTKGIQVPDSRVETIVNYPVPRTRKQLESFLGLYAFVHRFIPKASAITAPLNKLRGSKTDKELCASWVSTHDQAFRRAKEKIRRTTLLIHPRSDAHTELWTDASEEAIGAVLVQFVNGKWQPVAWWSKAFNNAQRAYSPFDKELVALSSSIEHFKDYVEGQQVTVRTDHKPLIGALKKTTNTFSPLQRRHFNKVAQYVQDVFHLEGRLNHVADALSRITCHTSGKNVLPDECAEKEVEETQLISPFVGDGSKVKVSVCLSEEVSFSMPSPDEFKCAQERDGEMQKWIQKHASMVDSAYDPQLVQCADVAGQMLWADRATEPARILVPTVYKRSVFSHVHNVSHPGFKATFKLLSKFYFWPNMKAEVRDWCRKCVNCQRNKVQRHTRAGLSLLPEPTKRFSDLHIDLVGPLNPPCQGKNMLLTIIDRWTGWAEALPLTMRGQAASAEACAKLLISQWIARFGIPRRITSDRGSQFVSKLWKELTDKLGIEQVCTTAYHPQHNGKIERFHRQLKNSLRARLDGQKNWLDQLPWVMLGLRSAPNLDTGVSPCVLVYGQSPDLPGQLVLNKAEIQDASQFGESLAKAMASVKFTQPKWHKSATKDSYFPKDLKTSEYVLVRVDAVQPSLRPRYIGPYKVVKRHDKFFVVQFPDKIDSVSVDRLIPFYC